MSRSLRSFTCSHTTGTEKYITGIKPHICRTLFFRNKKNILNCILIKMANENQTTPESDNDQSLNSSPPRAVYLDMPAPRRVQYVQSMSPKRLAEFPSSDYFYYGLDRCKEARYLWEMVVPVLPQGIPCYLPNIYAAMLQNVNEISIVKWEKLVKVILVSESRRDDSPITQHDDGSFTVDVHLGSWLSTHNDYSPEFVKIVQEEFELLKKAPVTNSNRASSSTEDAHSLENLGVISDGPLAGFNSTNPEVPPGMSPESVEELKGLIWNLNNPEMRSILIEDLLQVPQSYALHYARGLWRMSLYNDVLLKTVFETFCELASKSSTWAEIVPDTIFCVELQPQDEKPPFNKIVHAGIILPPNVSRVRIAGFLYLLNHMNQSPDNWKNVMSWLLQKHTPQFRTRLLRTLGNVGCYNKHLQGAIQSILKELLRSKLWHIVYLSPEVPVD